MAPTALAAAPTSAAGSAALAGTSAANPTGPPEERLRIEMLGAGQEVGRSCCVISYKGKTVVCDAGVHPAFTGLAALPFIDELDWSTVDAILITHFHLDHAAALTYIMEKTNFRDGRGKVYMTHPTKAVYRFLMSDFVRVSSAGSDDKLFDEAEMLSTWQQIEAVDYHQDVAVGGGLRFTPYHAGHVLGACMFLIEIAGLRVLYTGDYSREEDRHLVQAEVPPIKPDVLICESTYGVHSLEPRLEKEARFTSLVHSIIRRGGRVLLPVFVLGRAQELLLLLDEYWASHPELHNVPIYYASSLARRCIQVYQTYIHTMNDNIRSRFNRRDNPFVFKHISNLSSLHKFEDKGPCVMLASPGFMQSGVSRELLERWAPDKRNGLIISGYSVEGTMARNIMNDPEEIVGMNGQMIPRRLSVDYISFSAHVDYAQNSKFIEEVKAQHVVLVHGEANTMNKLRLALQSKFAERKEDIKIHTPRNCQVLELKFRAERTAKVIGTIAVKPPKENAIISGLLVSKDFAYTILDSKDLMEFTGLSTSTILQRQHIAIGVNWELIRWHLEGMYGSIVEGVDVEGRRTLRVMDVLDIKQSGKHQLTLEWAASTPNDMVADSAVALLLGVDSSPASVKLTTHPHSHSHGHDHAHAKEEEQGEEDSKAVLASNAEKLTQRHPFASDVTSQPIQNTQAALGLRPDAQPCRSQGADEGALALLDDPILLARSEHVFAFLEAHFGNVQEVVVGGAHASASASADATAGIKAESSDDDTGEEPLAVDGDGDADMDDAPAPRGGSAKQGHDQADAAMEIVPAGSSTAQAQAQTQAQAGATERPTEADVLRRMEMQEAAKPAIRIRVDEEQALVELDTLMVAANSAPLRRRIERLIAVALQSFAPLADSFIFAKPLNTQLFAGGHSQPLEPGEEPPEAIEG
ncbi:endoribonuclease ysh1 [Tilletia horrida]|nr:endoribonuclease ysh1 [Tilletia horrida]